MPIYKRKNKDESINYVVHIRKKNHKGIKKSFTELEDAELYHYYKSLLIDRMSAFEKPIEEMISIKQVIELKIKNIEPENKRALQEFTNAEIIVRNFFKDDRYCQSLTFKDWTDLAKYLLTTDVYKGAKTEIGKRKMSPNTLRRLFACLSSAFSQANSLGIPVDNLPLKVIQNYIRPMLENDGKTEEDIA